MFQEVEAPRFQENRHMKVVKLSVLRIGRLFPLGNISGTHLCWGQAVTQLVEALRYKPEGRGFDSRCCHWNFSLIQSFWLHYDPGVDSDSNRNKYQEYG